MRRREETPPDARSVDQVIKEAPWFDAVEINFGPRETTLLPRRVHQSLHPFLDAVRETGGFETRGKERDRQH